MGNDTLVEAHGAGSAGVIAGTSFAYDGRNRVIQASGTITPALTYAIAYAYDEVGNPLQKTYTLPGLPAPVQVAQTWDDDNRLTHIIRTTGANTVSVAKSYTPGGKLDTALYRTNGVPSAFTDTAYDSAGRVGSIKHCTNAACTTVRSQFTYAYDDDGNRTSETVLKGGVQTQIGYEIDGLGRLRREQRQQTSPPGPVSYNTTYSYDPVGNRLQSQDPVTGKATQTVYDAAHRTASVTDFQGPLPIRQVLYQYTPSGALGQRQSTLVQPPAEPLAEQFHYDCEGRLVDYVNLITGEIAAARYDGLGNKVLTGGTAGSKAMIYDGPNVAAEYNMAVPTAPVLTTTYLFGQEIDESLARIDAATGNPAFYLKDALGSTRQIVDQVSALKNDYEYKAFGEIFTQATSLPNNLLFTGRPLDPVSGLIDFRTRAYDPTDGRFLQPDPIYQGLILAPCVACWQNPLELMSVMPLYAYVGNNPTTYTDPTGEQWWFWHPWWWVSSWPWLYRPYAWWGWWYGPWGWSGLRWWWWRWWWPANPWWGGWWWWQWHWWWGGWWWPWWGNV
jgi:RHS repeat-associated protein